jgi:predicted ATP-dependent endonuclease of OLD family
VEVSLENSEMIITNAKIENFRALKKINVPIKSFSVIIGENDVGKTSFLYALEKFFENKKITEINDFFNKKPESHIKIILTFSNLPDDDELKPLIIQKVN